MQRGASRGAAKIGVKWLIRGRKAARLRRAAPAAGSGGAEAPAAK
jgi:hypothetical protein